jgi:hypothetical protein
MVVIYLFLVELAKTRFYRAPHATTPRIPASEAQRAERRIRRRASRFVHFAAAEEQRLRGSTHHA